MQSGFGRADSQMNRRVESMADLVVGRNPKGSQMRPVAERMRERVKKIAKSGCWEWQSTRNIQGYGILHIWNRRYGSTHRINWILHRGKIPRGLLVLHRCDNPICCNPDHLFLGTNKDNTHDMMRKGRMPRGADAPRAVLNEAAVQEIRQSPSGMAVPLAAKFGVTVWTIFDVRKRRSWAYVP